MIPCHATPRLLRLLESVASDAFGNLKKWQKYALERGNFSAIYPGLVYGGESRFTREGVDVMPWNEL